jgi:hypothetical protein
MYVWNISQPRLPIAALAGEGVVGLARFADIYFLNNRTDKTEAGTLSTYSVAAARQFQPPKQRKPHLPQPIRRPPENLRLCFQGLA